jgi:autotransporter adhesin
VTLHNVAAGVATTDAVNVGQLNGSNATVSGFLGGGANVAAGQAPSYTVAGNGYNSVGGAIGAINNRLNVMGAAIGDLQSQISDNYQEANAGVAAALAAGGLRRSRR